MIALKLVLEGLGLGFLLYLICAIGIRNGAVGMVHLYDQKVQERVVQPGLSTADEIRKRSAPTSPNRPSPSFGITGKRSSFAG